MRFELLGHGSSSNDSAAQGRRGARVTTGCVGVCFSHASRPSDRAVLRQLTPAPDDA
jgi:hypothetical protein